MLVEKEVIRPGTYWYTDEQTGLPKKLVVTPELTKYWHDQGNAMISAGLPVPVPYEHDFTHHPMTPKDKLLNNAGEVKQYSLKGTSGDRLYSTVDIQDPDAQKKVGHAMRWTSPWFNSFTDGDGKEWKNVISHLALTTRPRINKHKQEPFGSIAAALSMATETAGNILTSATSGAAGTGASGFCLSRAGRLFTDKKTKKLRPRYPMAFSLWGGGIKLAEEDAPPEKDEIPDDDADKGDEVFDAEDDENGEDMDGLMDPLQDANSDVAMEELLCDLLQALGVPMPDESNESDFKRHLYEAAMSKIKELTSKGMGKDEQEPDQNLPPNQQPNASQPQTNPLIQQEQQPMYMSLEDINKIADPTMKSVALSMHNENAALRAKIDANEKTANGLRDATLKDATAKRQQRVFLLGKASPKTKPDLDAMLALPSMALSMGEGGAVIDPMAQTLAILEKGLQDMPTLLRTEQSALSIQPHPVDQSEMTDEKSDAIADGFARQMGCPPQKKTA